MNVIKHNIPYSPLLATFKDQFEDFMIKKTSLVFVNEPKRNSETIVYSRRALGLRLGHFAD